MIDKKCSNIFRMNASIFGANTTLSTLYIDLPCTTCFDSFDRVVVNLPDFLPKHVVVRWQMHTFEF